MNTENTFVMRAECLNDAQRLQNIVKFSTFDIMKHPLFPDVLITVSTKLPLTGIKSLIKKIPDGHVMLETVALEADYTGERTPV